MPAPVEQYGLFRDPPDPRPRRQIESEIEEELRFHIEESVAERMADGQSEDGARAAAQQAFGDFDRIAASCRKIQLGERIMLQRINVVLLIVLVVAVLAIATRSADSQRETRRAMTENHMAMADMRAEIEDLTAVLLQARSQPDRGTTRLAAGDGAGEDLDPRSASPDEIAIEEREVEGWAERFIAKPDDWRHGLNLAYELAALHPDRARAILEQIYSRLPLDHRKQLFKPFVFHGGHIHAVPILHLGASDTDPAVAGRAFGYLKQYAFRDFSSNINDYLTWHERFGGLPLGEVLSQNAREAVARLASLDGDALAVELRAMDRPDLRTGEVAGIDLQGEFQKAGMEPLLQTWSSSDDADVQTACMRWAAALKLPESSLRNIVLPVLEGDQEFDENVVAEACNALGSRDNGWAVSPLLQFSEERLRSGTADEGRSVWSAAMALAEIGDQRAIPSLIGMIVADDSYETVYGIGHFGLSELTGVRYDETHDGAFWAEWWSQNRSRLTAEVRSMDLPRYEFDR